MIYYIDGTVSRQLAERELTPTEAVFFVELAVAHRRGFCVLCGERSALEALSERMGVPAEGIYRTILGRYAEQKAVLETVGFFSALTFDPAAPALPPALAGIEHMTVPIQEAQGCQFGRRCRLVGENLDDCRFYERVAESYWRKRSGRGLCVSFELRGGGGNTVAGEYEQSVAGDRIPTLCVVDSDLKYGATKRFPCVKRGQTLRQAEEADRRLASETAVPHRLYPLQVHEVENLIPLPVLKTLGDSVDTGAIERLRTVRGGEPLAYYDLKKGIVVKEDDEPFNEYWRQISRELSPEGEEPGTEIGTTLFRPVGVNKLLPKAWKKMGEGPGPDWPEGVLESHWAGLGGVLLRWGCAAEPLRA